jgi:hypothetical protein
MKCLSFTESRLAADQTVLLLLGAILRPPPISSNPQLVQSLFLTGLLCILGVLNVTKAIGDAIRGRLVPGVQHVVIGVVLCISKGTSEDIEIRL